MTAAITNLSDQTVAISTGNIRCSLLMVTIDPRSTERFECSREQFTVLKDIVEMARGGLFIKEIP